MIGYILGLFFVIIFVSFVVAMIDMAFGDDNWQKNVTVDDLRQIDKFIRE